MKVVSALGSLSEPFGWISANDGVDEHPSHNTKVRHCTTNIPKGSLTALVTKARRNISKLCPQTFNDCGIGHAATLTHNLEAEATIDPLEFVEHGRHKLRP